MDLNIHRAISFMALRRAQRRLGGDLMGCFHPLWLGNWLTDMNQASAFFDVLEADYKDPYEVWRGGKYAFAGTIQDHRDEWTRLFQTLWQHEWKEMAEWPAFRNLPASAARPASADDIGGYYTAGLK